MLFVGFSMHMAEESELSAQLFFEIMEDLSKNLGTHIHMHTAHTFVAPNI